MRFGTLIALREVSGRESGNRPLIFNLGEDNRRSQSAPLAGPDSQGSIQEASEWPLGSCGPFLGEGEWPAVFTGAILRAPKL